MKAINDLIKIASIEGIHPDMGAIAREEALRLWIKEYLVEVSVEQSIIKTKLTHEDEVFIKSYVASNITDDLFEDCVKFEISDRKVSGKVLAVKR